jgi:RND superfamily putative drug exporter
MSGVLTVAAGRRAKWVVLAVWIGVIAALTPFASKFESVQKNDAVNFLPADAQSTQAVELGRAFQREEPQPAIVVYRRESGLTPADRRRAEADQSAILAQRLPGVIPAPVPPQPSEDGKALLTVIPIAPGEDIESLNSAVAQIRERVAQGDEGDGGLRVAVTGPAGFSADFVEVFANINVQLFAATAIIVAILLFLTYLSPFLWLIPLGAVVLAEYAIRGAGYWLARAGATIDGQTAGLLLVLVFGAGTDYALLLTARYREELRRHEDKHEAMRLALRQAGPAILASAGTVIVALLCLLVAELNNNRGLGPVSAMGIALVMVAMLTALPALLLVFGRRAFWPYIPRYGSEAREESWFFGGIGRLIARRPRLVWLGTVLVLGALALGVGRTSFELYSDDSFRSSVESVEGAKLIEGSFPSGVSAATTVYVRPAAGVQAAARAARGTEGVVAQVLPPESAPQGDLARFSVVLRDDPYSGEAFRTVERLRERVGEGVVVGGPTAEPLDVRAASVRDATVIVPLILLAVLLILAALLRSVVAPLVLMGTVILSFAAAFGVSVLVFEYAFGFPGIDPSLPLLAFIFLVALGVDYNIFLMARVREETRELGTRRGMLKGLSVTGGVITSAGLVLAGTFAVLGVLPLVQLTQVGFVVAFGVLLDTLIVRSVLVPALTLDLGPRIWWPSSLGRREQAEEPRHAAAGRLPVASEAEL